MDITDNEPVVAMRALALAQTYAVLSDAYGEAQHKRKPAHYFSPCLG
jgi:hypothetical protein